MFAKVMKQNSMIFKMVQLSTLIDERMRRNEEKIEEKQCSLTLFTQGPYSILAQSLLYFDAI